MSFLDLPHEILIHIFDYVKSELDLQSISTISERFQIAISDLIERRKSQAYLAFTFASPLKWSYTLKNSMPSPQRRFGSCLILKDKRIYIFGGSTQDATSFNDMWCFDILSNSWERIYGSGALPSPRSSSKGAFDNDHLYFYGGCMAKPISSLNAAPQLPPEIIWTADLYRFTLNSRTWEKRCLYIADTRKNSLPNSQAGQSGSHLISNNELLFPNCLVLFGGFSSILGACVSDVYFLAYKLSQWTKIKLSDNSPIPQGRCGHAACVINDHQIVIYGGYEHIPINTTRNHNPESFAMSPFDEIWLLSRNASLDAWYDVTWTWSKVDVSNDGPLKTTRDFYHPQALCLPEPPIFLRKRDEIAKLIFIDQCDPKSLALAQKARRQLLDETHNRWASFLQSDLWARCCEPDEKCSINECSLRDVTFRSLAPQKLGNVELMADKQLKIYCLSIDSSLNATWNYPSNNTLLDQAWAPIQRLGFSTVFCEGYGVYIFGGFLATTELSRETFWFESQLLYEWTRWVKNVDNVELIRRSVDHLIACWSTSEPNVRLIEKFEFITLTPRSLWLYSQSRI